MVVEESLSMRGWMSVGPRLASWHLHSPEIALIKIKSGVNYSRDHPSRLRRARAARATRAERILHKLSSRKQEASFPQQCDRCLVRAYVEGVSVREKYGM